jgi:Fe-S-cluster-containing dehydrogenase component/formate-dependent nitrite reductase membrane component NrfD
VALDQQSENYGFVIDNRTCIGCHACSTACKSEHEVPLGVYRTWVKYTEVGQYPDVTRNFQVTRCNHCDNAPCVRICPTTAMYQRADGIVDFDNNECIGCKACIQACPYDAIHIDPETSTAAKCNFCAHRKESGLEPSCVVVCPTHSIISGDLNDPTSEISHVLGKEKVSVRKPEQGTAPKLFYIDGDANSLNPTNCDQTPDSFLWADVVSEKKFGGKGSEERHYKTTFQGEKARVSQTQGLPNAGTVASKPVYSPDFENEVSSEHMVQTAYNAQHKIYWHWPVPAYLVTKGLSAGIVMLLTFIFGTKLLSFDQTFMLWGLGLSLFFILVTTALLVYDLDRPERFLRIILRPQWKSWLTRGSFILIGFSNIIALWFILELAFTYGFMKEDLLLQLRPFLYWPSFLLALGTAIYTAFLFAQAEGRDLWQSSSLPWHLFVQAILAGSALQLTLGLLIDPASPLTLWAQNVLLGSLLIDGLFQLLEFSMPHASEVATRAAHEIVSGHYKKKFWLGNIMLGHVLSLGALYFFTGPLLLICGSIMAIIGLYIFEHCFVDAPQRIPNS